MNPLRPLFGTLVGAFALVATTSVAAPVLYPVEAKDRVDDADTLCRFVASDYAYLDRKTIDWPAVCADTRDAAASADSRDTFVLVLERAVHALYDAHAHLGTSGPQSTRLVPTDTDVVATWTGDDATITDVRDNSAALAAGLATGMRVVRIDDRSTKDAAAALEARPLLRPDAEARDFALQLALAGRQDGRPVRLTVRDGDKDRLVEFVPKVQRPAAPVSAFIDGDVAVVRINNALGDPYTVTAFDRALDTMTTARALILDLRDTPSGGTSSVARGIMGRLVAKEAPYQRHELVSEQKATQVRRVWVEYVEPRESNGMRPFRGDVVVLVGRWTGSMAEGMAIGLNAARGARVVGRPMARLAGALDEITLPHSQVVVRVPTEKLFHVDGTPREAFVPQALDVSPLDRREGDGELAATVRLLTKR